MTNNLLPEGVLAKCLSPEGQSPEGDKFFTNTPEGNKCLSLRKLMIIGLLYDKIQIETFRSRNGTILF